MHRFLLCAAALLILQGCAGAPPKTQAQAQDPGCIRETGSRIEHAGCNGEPGRSYTHEDIERTGSTSTGDALQRMDPAIRAH